MAVLMVGKFNAEAWVVFLLYSVALLISIKRMYVGAHYPQDVLAGTILGSARGLPGVLVDGYVMNRIG